MLEKRAVVPSEQEKEAHDKAAKAVPPPPKVEDKKATKRKDD